MSNSLDPDLGPNSLQKVSAEDTSWQIVNIVLITSTHHLYKYSIMPMCLRNCRSSDDFIIFFIKMHAMDEYSETYNSYLARVPLRYGSAHKIRASREGACADPEGGTGGLDPLWKITSYISFYRE